LQQAHADEKKIVPAFYLRVISFWMAHREKWIAAGADPLAHFSDIINTTEIRIANLECVVATTGHAADKNFTFRAAPKNSYYLASSF
jgi:hypothetical protein